SHHQSSLLGQLDSYYRDDSGQYGYEVFSVVYSTLDDLRAELANFGISYKARDIHYISPLQPVPVVPANDYAALQPLYDAGLVERDVVTFSPGVNLSNLTVLREQIADGVSVRDNALVLSWNGGHALRVALAQHDDPIGTGIERYLFADGTSISTKDLLALAKPIVVHQGPDDFTFVLGIGIQTLDPHYTHIYFEATLTPDVISFGRSDADLVIARKGSEDRLTLANWYEDPNAIPSVVAQFYNGGSILDAAALT